MFDLITLARQACATAASLRQVAALTRQRARDFTAASQLLRADRRADGNGVREHARDVSERQ
jgi:hypothetical protein